MDSAQRVRRVEPMHYGAWLQLVAIFARQLGERGNELAVREAEGRHPLVRRVKEFIVLHAGEEIMLRRAAAVAGFSPCYFCKLFHRVSGMGFTEYLARLRVEAAKSMLLDPHTRINEAAFRAGFQSLSQFNREFRRITGEAPSAHRDRLGAFLGSSRPTGTNEPWSIAA
jgi:AraC-like DNA-binding protein